MSSIEHNQTERDRLINLAVDKKGTGEFRRAFVLYLEALKLDPDHAPTYAGLGRASYLLDERFTALRCYLAAMHLHINDIQLEVSAHPASPDSRMLRSQYQTLSSQAKEMLPTEAASIIMYHASLAKQAAHAFFDLNCNYPELTKYALVYRAELQSDTSFRSMLAQQALSEADYHSQDREFYVPKGQDFFFKVLQWPRISGRDVLNIYFRSADNDPRDILLCTSRPPLAQAG